VDRLPVGWDEGPGLVASVWRYRWLVAAVALAGALAGLGVSFVQPVLYEASGRILLTVPPGGDQEPDRFVRNEAALMVSPVVLDRAVRGVEGRVSVKQLRERLVAEPSTESDLVTLRVRDSDAQGAAALVTAVGGAYRATLVERAKGEHNRAVEQAQATMKTLRERLAGLNDRLRAAPDDATVRSQRDAVAGLLGQAQRREQELLLAGPANDPVALLERVEVPEEPAQPQPLRLVALGGLLGSVLAAGLAWWLAGRRQAPPTTQPQGWPAPLPGTRPVSLRARLAARLRVRLPKRKKATPGVTLPPGVRPDPDLARERLVAVLAAERRRKEKARATVTLGEESEVRNGHRPSGNGSGRLGGDLGHLAEDGGAPEPSARTTPDESNGDASPS
jgi:uncharacterized protein involved in exopolysaccharide biosynthesis